MRFSLQIHHAVCGIFDLAYNGQGAPVQVRVIGERQAIPTRYLEQIFQRLRRAGLVVGKRGPGGGYTLARPPAEISLRDVIEAVEGGPLAEHADPGAAGKGSPYRPDFLWGALAASIAELLAEHSLEQLCAEAARASVGRVAPPAHVYHI